jgi:phosphate transport system substrate-binding protein
MRPNSLFPFEEEKIFMSKRQFLLMAVLSVTTLALAACTGGAAEAPAEEMAEEEMEEEEMMEELSGTIVIDGSSTVEPISTLVSSFFTEAHPDVEVPVGTSGTGGGFEKFCNGETDISDASRPVKDEEAETCAAAGIEFSEFQVGIDALTVVVNPENDFAQCLTTEQLAVIYGADSEGSVTNWNQVDPSFPDLAMDLYAPDADSGTFDFFNEVITDDEYGGARVDYTPSTDDNVLVQGVQGSPGGISYFGLAYYLENQETLTAVAVDNGDGCVEPSFEAALDGSYTPLSRPLFIYVKNSELCRPEVQAFVEFYLSEDSLTTLVGEAGYASMPEADRQASRDAFAAATAEFCG